MILDKIHEGREIVGNLAVDKIAVDRMTEAIMTLNIKNQDKMTVDTS